MASPRFASFTSPGSYWQASRAPRYSLPFALPLLLCYQTLAVFLSRGPHPLRNGADVILQSFFVAIAGPLGPLLFMISLLARGLRPVAPGAGGRPGHRPRRRDLLGLSLHRPLRRPARALFVRIPDDRGAVLQRAVSPARVRDHGVDARALRRITAGDTVNSYGRTCAFASSRNLKRWIFPVAVFGSSGTNTIQRGYL